MTLLAIWDCYAIRKSNYEPSCMADYSLIRWHMYLLFVVDLRIARVPKTWKPCVLNPPAHRPDRVARGDLPVRCDLAREGFYLGRDIGAEHVRVQPLSGSKACIMREIGEGVLVANTTDPP